MYRISALKVLLWMAIVARGEDWNYGNVSEWDGECQAGTQQSPIDLVERDAVTRIYSAFVLKNYDISSPAKANNNGHTVTITLQPTGENIPTVSGGGLVGEYKLDHFHFHWQSEHTIAGDRYPLEMHLVHYSAQYDSLNDAVGKQDGLAVLGVLFDRSIDDDEDFIPLIEVMDKISRDPDNEIDLERSIVARNFLPRNIGDYYRYMGSLTTPSCNEGVIWTVFEQTLPLSSDQIKHFESVWTNDGPLTLNYRPVQPVNDREITLRSSRNRGNGGGAASSSIILLTIASVLIFLKTKLL